MFKRARTRSKPAAHVISEAQSAAVFDNSLHIKARTGRVRQAERAKTRIMMCAAVFVFIFTGLAGRLAIVSFGQDEPATRVATTKAKNLPRVEITDRNGTLLATDLPMIVLEVAGNEVWDAHETAYKLAEILPDIDAPALENKLKNRRYEEVRTDLTPAERRAVFDLGLPGIHFTVRMRRFYPQADLGAHIVGHEELGKGGIMGLEKVANGWRGNASGSMRASIDIRVQQVLEDELAAGMEEFSAEAAWGAMMDVATGEIIALASLPDFDPNAPGASPADSRRNRATYDRYELGSAFKSFTAAAALEEGIANEGTSYDARKPFIVADRVIRDYHGENRVLTLSEVVQHSSNIGIAQIAIELGAARQKKYLSNLGLFDVVPMELSENRMPDLPSRWGPVETATIAYGHGIAVTPLHLLAAFSVVVNGGTYHAPTFLATDEKLAGARVFSKDTSIIMRRILRRVLTDGTAKFAKAPGYFPIGKTSTADKPVAGGYSTNARISSFVGAVPGYAPRYVILVSFDNPQGTKETYGYASAGWNAAPVFSRVVERAAPLLGLSPVNEATALAAFVSGDTARFQEASLGAASLERLP